MRCYYVLYNEGKVTMEEKALSNRKRILNDLHEMKTVGELVDYIPIAIVQKIAFIILMTWSVSPIFVMGYGVSARLPDDANWLTKLNQMNIMSINWYRILQQLGFIGCLVGILILMKSVRDGKKESITFEEYIKDRIVPISLFLMLIWSVLSFAVSAGDIYSLTEDFNEVLIGGIFKREGILTYLAIAGIFSCGFIVRSKKQIRWIIKLNTIVAVIQSILILIDLNGINEFFGLTDGSGVFLNINHAGYYLSMSAMCGAYLAITEKKSKTKSAIYIIMFGLIAGALVSNSSLGPYLATLSALISSVILAVWLNKILLSRVITVIVVFFISTIIVSAIDGSLLVALQLFGIELGMIASGQVELDMGSNRLELWKLGVDFIVERPLFGYGPAGLTYAYKEVLGSHNRPHNEFIEHAATIGIPGLLFYVMALFNYLKKFYLNRNRVSTLSIGLLCIAISYLVSSLLGVTMFHTSAFFFMFSGLSIGQFSKTNVSL